MRKNPRAPVDSGIELIDAWVKWFRDAHEQRLQSESEFPDRHLVAQERAKIDALATAIAARMRADYLVWSTRP